MGVFPAATAVFRIRLPRLSADRLKIEITKQNPHCRPIPSARVSPEMRKGRLTLLP